jgi:hypothetical protein
MDDKHKQELYEEEILRSLEVVNKAWSSDIRTYGEDDLLEHINGLIEVVERKKTFSEFVDDNHLERYKKAITN